MLDQILGWFVIFAPVALSGLFILIPAKAESRRANMRWRWALLLFGGLFSGVAWWQQSRAVKAAQASTTDAINRTSEKVAAEVKKADKVIIDTQNVKIDQLQKSLDEQGRGVKEIGERPFLTGVKPVRVEVTNPQPESIAPKHEGHLTVSQRSDISTRNDAPFKTTITVQTDIEFPTLKLVVTCDKDLIAGSGTTNGMLMISRSGLITGRPNMVGFEYSSATPPFGPANPAIFSVWSKDPVTCTQASTF